jgi:hypothetical protein
MNRARAGLLAAALAAWTPATGAARDVDAAAGEPGARPRVRLLVDPATSGESAPTLVRAELEASGFAVEMRRADTGGTASWRSQPGLFAEVGFGRADGRATAEVKVFAADRGRPTTHRVDVGPLPARSQGQRTRVLVTLAVRVGELLRAHVSPPRPPKLAEPPRPSLVDRLLAAPPPPPPPPLAAPDPLAGPAPAAATAASPAPEPARASVPAPEPARPSVSAPEPPARAPAPAPVAVADRAAAAASAGAAPRVPGVQLDGGVAVGRSISEVGLAFGPVLRASWLRSSGLLARATVAALLGGEPLAAPSGQARLYQTIGLGQVGYQGQLWRGRIAPEATVGLGAQHVLASGRATAGTPAAATSESAVAFAVAAGAGVAMKLSPSLSLALGADVYRAIPRPVVLAPPPGGAPGGEVVIGQGAPVSFFVTAALKMAL